MGQSNSREASSSTEEASTTVTLAADLEGNVTRLDR
jgi:hypothetical protein